MLSSRMLVIAAICQSRSAEMCITFKILPALLVSKINLEMHIAANWPRLMYAGYWWQRDEICIISQKATH